MMRIVLGLVACTAFLLVLGGCGEGEGSGVEGQPEGRRPVPEQPKAPPGASFSEGGAEAGDTDPTGGGGGG